MDVQHLKDRIAEYRQQKEQFLAQAQQQLAAMDGGIQALGALVKEEEGEPGPPPEPAGEQ